MSTEYPVFKRDREEFFLTEHSGLLDISLNEIAEDYACLRDLTPLQVAAIGIELLRIADYQDDEVSSMMGDQFPSTDLQQWSREYLGR